MCKLLSYNLDIPDTSEVLLNVIRKIKSLHRLKFASELIIGFYESNDPTDSVKALKEVIILRIGFNPTRSTSPCYNPTHACNIQ